MYKVLVQKTVLKLEKCFPRTQNFSDSHAASIHLTIKLNLVDTDAWFDLCAHRERVCRYLFELGSIRCKRKMAALVPDKS